MKTITPRSTPYSIEKILQFIFLLLIFNLPGSSLQADHIRFERAVLNLGSSCYGGFLRDQDGFLWFGTIGSGLFRYDGYELKNYKQGPNSLSGAMVSSLVEDQDGVLWIATFSEGVTQYDKSTETFTHHKHDPSNQNSLSSNTIPIATHAIYVDHNNILWVGSVDGGLNRYDKKSGKWTNYRHSPNNPNSLSHDTVVSIIGDPDGTLWIGTKEGGLNHFDPKNKTWTRYQNDPKNPNSLSDNWIYTMLVD